MIFVILGLVLGFIATCFGPKTENMFHLERFMSRTSWQKNKLILEEILHIHYLLLYFLVRTPFFFFWLMEYFKI